MTDVLQPPQLSLDRCPYCGVAQPLLLQVWAGLMEGADKSWGRVHWAAFTCATCGGVVTAHGYPGSPINFRDPLATYPAPRAAHSDLPDQVRRYLEQAFATLAAPDAAAMVAGSAVDAMLKALGYVKGTVYERIDLALVDNKLTAGMANWAHSVRLGANRPRHADVDSPHVTPSEAKQSVDFAEALGNFLFVLTARIDRALAEATVES